MSVRVRLHRDGAITCHHDPHWLLRLLGFEPSDYEVEFDGLWWRNADTGAAVSQRAAKAIERELARRSAARRMFIVR